MIIHKTLKRGIQVQLFGFKKIFFSCKEFQMSDDCEPVI